eukprot:CAMPEP_0170596876 /NCGR_PEP_ID=MMETSP0224-20130122/15377_1 /TAXON_ID=285029 /ORGANISM="Togula jolla, Strain CCCM 725" /LENGTH=63 /DNA_ID=CAMNT_0010921249 /DNA_START=79 /DNA_END=266 /DNA_ORIENTATION=+
MKMLEAPGSSSGSDDDGSIDIQPDVDLDNHDVAYRYMEFGCAGKEPFVANVKEELLARRCYWS